MNGAPITAEDLALYALDALDSAATSRIDVLLRSSSEARTELSLIRGDLAVLALSAQQHTPPALSRQRLLKQVAREHRLPIPVAAQDEPQFAIDPPAIVDPAAPTLLGRTPRATTEERRARVRLPRIVAEPEPLFMAEESAAPAPPAHIAPVDTRSEEQKRAERIVAGLRSAPIESAGTPISSFSGAVGPVFTGNTNRDLPADPSHEQESVAATRSSSTSAGILFQMPPASDVHASTEEEDRYTPSAGRITAHEDAPHRSRTAVVMAWAGWVAAAGLAAATILTVRNNTALQQQIHTQQTALVQTRATAARADAVLQTLESGAAQRFVLARQDTAPIPSARVAYLPERGSLVFQGTNLEQLPPYKTYELWLIPTGAGAQPIPAGTFKPDARGYATLLMPALPGGTVAGNFGVTIEDETGSTVPTLPILLIGQTG